MVCLLNLHVPATLPKPPLASHPLSRSPPKSTHPPNTLPTSFIDILFENIHSFNMFFTKAIVAASMALSALAVALPETASTLQARSWIDGTHTGDGKLSPCCRRC